MNGTRIEPLGPLGPGAPGRALLVLDHATGMQVAGKRLTPPAGVPVDRIRQEAMALGGGHPSINPVFDVVADGGAVWVLSQAVPGRSLRAEVHRRGALGPAVAASIGLAVLAALTLDRAIAFQIMAARLGQLRPMTPAEAEKLFPQKFPQAFVEEYWNYLVRKLERAAV